MVRICVWVGICAALTGCEPGATSFCDGGLSAVAQARSLSQAQLSDLSERIVDLHRQHPNGLRMEPEGTNPIPEDFGYLDALSIRLEPGFDSRISLYGCVDEYSLAEQVYLAHGVSDIGVAEIRLAQVRGTQETSEVLWSGSVASDDLDVEEQLEALISSQYQEISSRYLASADDFDRLADRMAQERDVVLVHCDENLRYVQTRTSVFYEGEDSETLTTYLELCSFENKVVANAGHATGISFPHQLKEIGPMLVSTHLVHRLDDSIDFERCAEVNLDEQWGDCQEPISGPWFAHYSWGPACSDDAGPEDGC